MASKFIFFALLASLAVAHGATLSLGTEIVAKEDKQGRVLLEVPIIGTIILKTIKVGWVLIKTAWSLIGWKLTALAVAIKAAYWAFNHFSSVMLGASVMYCFCKVTGKCSWDYVPHQLYNVGETLVYAAKNLEGGASKYGSNFQ